MNQTTTPTIQSTSIYFKEGNSDKEYRAAIEPRGEGYIVTFACGRRGNTLNLAGDQRVDSRRRTRSRLVQPSQESIRSRPGGFDQSPTWQAPEIQLEDGRTLVLEYT